jgi:hypothetical protein
VTYLEPTLDLVRLLMSGGGLVCALSAFAVAYLPKRVAPVVEVAAPTAVWCERSQRWRSVQTGRYVKAP